MSETNYINDEVGRLTQKQTLVDSAITGKLRMDFLNNNYFERNSVYTQMIITIVICLALFIIITLLQRYFPVIPSVVTDLLSGLIFSGMIIYIGWLLYTISIRDNINFSEIHLAPPPINYVTSLNKDASITNTIDLTKPICAGKECCETTHTKWDDGANKCVKL